MTKSRSDEVTQCAGRAASHQYPYSSLSYLTSSLRHSVTPSLPDTCDILTIGQYLQPTRNHLPIDRWVTPEQFAAFREAGLEAGFKVVESGPLVRSSYHADHQADVLSTIGAERDRRT